MLAKEIIKNYENKVQLLEKRWEQYAQAYDSLLAQIKELQRYRFGKKFEHYIDPEHPQLNLIDNKLSIFATADIASKSIIDDVQAEAQRRKKKPKLRKTFPLKLFLCRMNERHALRQEKSNLLTEKFK